MKTEQKMEPAEIKYRLQILGYTFVDLDRKYNLPRGTARSAASHSSKKGEKVIALTLGLEPKEIWPNRYDSYGNRLRPQPKEEYLYTPKMRAKVNKNA